MNVSFPDLSNSDDEHVTCSLNKWLDAVVDDSLLTNERLVWAATVDVLMWAVGLRSDEARRASNLYHKMLKNSYWAVYAPTSAYDPARASMSTSDPVGRRLLTLTSALSGLLLETYFDKRVHHVLANELCHSMATMATALSWGNNKLVTNVKVLLTTLLSTGGTFAGVGETWVDRWG